MSITPAFMYELNLRVGEIVEEVRNADIYVSHELVAQILADRYNVVSLSQLGVLSPKSLPLLGLVFSLNSATYNYCISYLATHEISSIIDIEAGLLCHLRTLHLPSLLFTCTLTKSAKQSDPNELSLPEEDSNPNSNKFDCKINCFLDFGLGRLTKSPALSNIFGATNDGHGKSESAVLHNLTRYILQQENELIAQFDRDNFVAWLCKVWKISQLSEVGVIIQSNIDSSIATIKSTLRFKVSLLHTHKRQLYQQLSSWENEENERVQSNQRKRRKKQSPGSDSVDQGNLLLEILNCVQNEFGRDVVSDKVNATEIIGEVMDTIIALRLGHTNNSTVDKVDAVRSIAIAAIEDSLKSRNEQERLKVSPSTGSKPQLKLNVDTRKNLGNTASDKKEKSQDNAWEEYVVEITNEMLRPILLPAFTSSILSNQDIGQLGEGLVYQYLQRSLPTERFSVQWLNQDNETKAAYDFIVEDLNAESGSTFHHKTFIEVKSSRYEDNNVFSISLWEWQFITQLPRVEYHIYRVFGVGDPHKTHITILKDAHKLLEVGRIHLCLSI